MLPLWRPDIAHWAEERPCRRTRGRTRGEEREGAKEGEIQLGVGGRAPCSLSPRPPLNAPPLRPPSNPAFPIRTHAKNKQKGSLARPFFFLLPFTPTPSNDDARSALERGCCHLAPLGRGQGHQVRRGARPDGGELGAPARLGSAAHALGGAEDVPPTPPPRSAAPKKTPPLSRTRAGRIGPALARARGAKGRDGRQCRLSRARRIGRASRARIGDAQASLRLRGAPSPLPPPCARA